MRQLPFDKLRLLRVGEWVALLTAVGLAVVAALRDSVALAGWSAAGVVLLLGGAALLAGRLAAALLVTRRQAEEQARALHESEIRTRTIVDTAADGIVTIDERGIVESFNAAAGRIFGYSADEVIGQSISLLMPSPEREQHQGHVAHHIRSGEAKGIGVARERVGLRKDGTAIPIESAVSEVRLPGRRLFAGIIRDVRERKRAETALRESRGFLQKVIDGTTDPLLVIDRDYRVVLSNRAAREMAGREFLTSGCLACHQFSHRRDQPCDGAEHPCPLRDVVATKAPVTVTHTHFDAGGSAVVVEISASPILDEDGEVVQVIELSRDITARVRAEERARQHQAELAHVARLGTMGEMATGLAHELNQPLAAIVNYIQACLERIRGGARDPGTLLEDMERAAGQAERAGEMIEHVRDFVRKREPRRTSVSLNAVVREAVALMESELRHQKTTLRMDLADGLPEVNVQAIQIEQVVVNLLRNGLEAMADNAPEDRHVTLQTSKPEDAMVELAVCDTGRGLPAEISDQVFDPFFTTKPEGMGMGLSISETIIEAHGGRLSSIDNPDRGSTFRFTLPTAGGTSRDQS